MDELLTTKIIDFLASVFLMLGFVIGTNRKIFGVINLYAIQSVVLAVLAIIIGYAHSETQLFISAAFVIIIKVWIIPSTLRKTMRKVKIENDIMPYLSQSLSMAIETVLIIISYNIVSTVFDPAQLAYKNTLAVSIAVFLIGFFMMINRRRTVSQVIGFLLMENGLFFFAISLAYGMPLIVELGVFFDVLVVSLILGIFIYKIKESFYSIDTKDLNKLID
jgi:hydrogenase-4 membrane subunit HyfE